MQGKGGQLQAGNPTFGTGFQRGDVFRREVQAHRLVEKFGGLRGGEAQVRGAQLGQLAPGTQTSEWQVRILTGGDDQVHLWRQVLEKEGEGVVDPLGVDQVEVIEDQDDPVREGGYLVDQRGQDGFGRRWLGGAERAQCSFPDAGFELSARRR